MEWFLTECTVYSLKVYSTGEAQTKCWKVRITALKWDNVQVFIFCFSLMHLSHFGSQRYWEYITESSHLLVEFDILPSCQLQTHKLKRLPVLLAAWGGDKKRKKLQIISANYLLHLPPDSRQVVTTNSHFLNSYTDCPAGAHQQRKLPSCDV